MQMCPRGHEFASRLGIEMFEFLGGDIPGIRGRGAGCFLIPDFHALPFLCLFIPGVAAYEKTSPFSEGKRGQMGKQGRMLGKERQRALSHMLIPAAALPHCVFQGFRVSPFYIQGGDANLDVGYPQFIPLCYSDFVLQRRQ